MSRKIYLLILLANYCIGILCIGESLLFSSLSILHYTTGMFIRTLGLFLEFAIWFRIIYFSDNLLFKGYGIAKVIIAILLTLFISFTDKAIAGWNKVVLMMFSLTSLILGLINVKYKVSSIFSANG